MNRVREIVAYRNYFEDFLKNQPVKVQNKIFKIMEEIEILERVPNNYLKSIRGVKGLYEIRISHGSNTWRIFCFFDSGKLVILLNGFIKKRQKIPGKEIQKAVRMMHEYFNEKSGTNEK